ncbi:MAG: hypothetical protein QG671_3867, partial [Actinomycetota bacterium]|nr:hypothetical protein [Actinomycetota bacterium]
AQSIPAQASDRPMTAQAAAPVAAEVSIVDGLESQGFDVSRVTVTTDRIEVDAEAAGPDPFAFDLTIDPDTARGTYTVTDMVKGQIVTTPFTVAIQTSTPERSVFTLTNPATGEIYRHDSAVSHESIAFVIPIAFAAVSLSTALYYLAIGAAIVVAGVLALEAAKAVSKIIEENGRRSSSKKRDYFVAVRSGSKVYLSPVGLTKTQALARGRTSGDVWALSRDLAKGLAKDLNPSGVPVGPEKHGSGYLLHFHPFNHVPNMHSFFGVPS